MDHNDYLELVQKYNTEALYPTDMPTAIIGIATNSKGRVCLVLDSQKCCSLLEKQGMSEEEALEFFEFNTAGAYMGESTPIFIDVRNNWD